MFSYQRTNKTMILTTLAFSLALQGCNNSNTEQPTANLPAEISIEGPEQSDEQTSVTLTSNLLSDDTVTNYHWQQTAGPAISFNQDNQAKFEFQTPAILMSEGPSPITISVTITTADNQTAQAQLTAVINPVNEAPNVTLQQVQIEEGSVSELTIEANDSDGSINNTQWIQTSGPSVDILTSSITALTFISPHVIEQTPVTFEATVWDNEQHSTQLQINQTIDNKAQFVTDPLTLLDSSEITLRPYSPIYADWDQDGDQDVIVIQQLENTRGQIYYYKNDGTGTFELPPIKLADLNGSAIHDRPAVLDKLDINNDGKPELLIGSFYGGSFGWLDISTEQSNEIVWVDQSERTVLDIGVADINNDGRDDVYTNANGNIYWYANNGDGQFANPVLLTTVPTNSIGFKRTKIQFADIDNDNKQDLIMASREHHVQIFWGLGAGQFSAPTQIAAAVAPSAILIKDINNDNKIDIILTEDAFSDFSNRVSVFNFINQGNRSFATELTDINYLIEAASIADVNNDGHNDLIISNRTVRARPDGVSEYGNEVIMFSNYNSSNQTEQILYYGANAYDGIHSVQLDQDADLEIAYSARSPDSFYYLNHQATATYWQRQSFTKTKLETGFPRQSMLAFADIDQDGKEDIIAAGDKRLAIYKGPISHNQPISAIVENDGSNLIDQPYPQPNFDKIISLDWDSDGLRDIIAATSNKVYLYRQIAPMSFEKGELLHQADVDIRETIQYLFAHNDNEIIVASSQLDIINNQSYIKNLTFRRISQTQATLSTTINFEPQQERLILDVQLADINNDGNQEIIVVYRDQEHNIVDRYRSTISDENWQISLEQSHSIASSSTFTLHIGEFNNNGKLDFLFNHQVADSWEPQLSFYFNDGQGNIKPQPDAILTNVCHTPTIVNMDNDDDNDLFCQRSGELISLENPGNGIFQPQTETILNMFDISGANKIYFYDVDGDSDRDLLMLSTNQQRLFWTANSWQ